MQYTPHFVEQVRQSKFFKNLQAGVLEIDNSTFTQWDGCFASGIYNGVLRRVNARSRSALAFGSCVHQGLETYLKLRYCPAISPACCNHSHFVPRALEAAFNEAAKTQLDSLGDPKRNTRILETLLRSYLMEYDRKADMRFNIPLIDGLPAVERSFSVPLGTLVVDRLRNINSPANIQVMWQGKMDLIDEADGKIWPVDHKTTSVMGEKFIDDKERSSQMLGYTYACKWLSDSVFGGKPVGGVRINALAQRTGGFEFKLFTIPYSDWQVAEFQGEILLKLARLVRELDEFISTGELAPTRSHCVTKYGKCAYFDVCNRLPVMRDRTIFDDSYFEVSNWSPLGE